MKNVVLSKISLNLYPYTVGGLSNNITVIYRFTQEQAIGLTFLSVIDRPHLKTVVDNNLLQYKNNSNISV